MRSQVGSETNLTSFDADKADYNCKLVIVGDSGVGKSSIVQQFLSRKRGPMLGFEHAHSDDATKALTTRPQTPTTIGVNISAVNVRIPYKGGSTVSFSAWDTAGQERFLALAPMYYRNAEAVMLVYDVTSPNSIQNIPKWLQMVKENNLVPLHSVLLVANKIDEQQSRRVPAETGQLLAAELGHSTKYIETSIYHSQSIIDVWQYCARDYAQSKQRIIDLRNRGEEVEKSIDEVDRGSESGYDSVLLHSQKHTQTQTKTWKDRCC